MISQFNHSKDKPCYDLAKATKASDEKTGLLSFGKGLGGRRGSWSFWTLSLSSNLEYRGRVNAECHKTLVPFSRHLLPEDAEGVRDLLGELDTFFGNVLWGCKPLAALELLYWPITWRLEDERFFGLEAKPLAQHQIEPY